MDSDEAPRDQQATDVPDADVGKLEPNYYCRAWNAKREKYCRSRAGRGTEHPGVGRCHIHDGGANLRIKHGQSRRYASLTSKRLADRIAQHEQDEKPLDLLPELATTRAMFEEFLDLLKDEPDAASLAEGIKLVERIARIVEGIEKVRSQSAITLQELERLMLNMGLVVRQHVADDAACQKIREGWLALRI